MKFQAPKGVSEYMPPKSQTFAWVRNQFVRVIGSNGYELVELPVFEDTELFTRIGASTDVVSKEMYTFEDRGGRSITLRPEGTVGALRAVIEHELDRGSLPDKVYYSGAYFRAERPQAGRYRQFYSVGAEAIGSEDPALDAEMIAMADSAFRSLGLSNFTLQMTCLGESASRAAHRVDLVKFIAKLDLDEATRERAALNPLRLFDDKREEIRSAMSDAPRLLDYLSQESAEHFAQVQELLTALGIKFEINPRMVRGLDYYTGTTFEFVHHQLGAQSGIGGGGRYDGLMREIGGQDISGIGFGLGVDRAILALEAEGKVPAQTNSDLFLIPLGPESKARVLQLAAELRASGLIVEVAYGDKSLKSAMKQADKSAARYSAVVGESELSAGSVEVKEMASRASTSVTLSALPTFFTSN